MRFQNLPSYRVWIKWMRITLQHGKWRYSLVRQMRLKRTKTPKPQVLWLWTLQAAQIRGWFENDNKHLSWLILSRYRNKINVCFGCSIVCLEIPSKSVAVDDSNNIILSSEMRNDMVSSNAMLEVGRAMRT
jgi:hypothetical protein